MVGTTFSTVCASGWATADAGELADRPIIELAGRLGARTAELHRAFATPTDDPAFAAEPVGPEVLRAWGEDVRATVERALDGLDHGTPNLAPAKEQAHRLLARRQEVLDEVDRLLPSKIDAVRTRFHGDLHLGQILIAEDDAFIIDFEGEPMRSLAERREKNSPLRDVAGMLRSFAYAAATVGRDQGNAAEQARLQAWVKAVSDAFLDSYWRTIGDCPSVPADRADALRLLRLFLLAKAAYEVNYELANRPEWVGTPIAGMRALLGGTGEEGAHSPVGRPRHRHQGGTRPVPEAEEGAAQRVRRANDKEHLVGALRAQDCRCRRAPMPVRPGPRRWRARFTHSLPAPARRSP